MNDGWKRDRIRASADELRDPRNTDTFLHAHLFARYEWGSPEHIERPEWLYDPSEFYSARHALSARHDDLRAGIVAEFERVRG